MIPLAAMTASQTENRSWLPSAILAGILTAVVAYLTANFIQAENLPLYVITLLLIGAAPVLGYGIATRSLSIGALIGGIIGSIPVIGVILWPILVGAFSSRHGIGSLFMGSILGLLLGLAAFFAIGSGSMGQDPAWLSLGFTIGCAVWGGTCGAALAAWQR